MRTAIVGGEEIVECGMSEPENSALSYPAELDIRFENALRGGDAETALEVVKQFGQKLRSQRYSCAIRL